MDKLSQSDLPFYRKLGRTDLTVSCLGLGGGASISSEDTLHALNQGINYFFYSSDLHHYIYSSMSNALRQLCSRRSSVREKVVLATVTYIKIPEAAVAVAALWDQFVELSIDYTVTYIKIPEAAVAALWDQFVELSIDYIDVLFWGWIGTNDGQALQDCLQLSPGLRWTNSVYQRTIKRMFGTSERLKKNGCWLLYWCVVSRYQFGSIVVT